MQKSIPLGCLISLLTLVAPAAQAELASLVAPLTPGSFDPPKAGTYALPPVRAAPEGQVLDIDGRQTTLRSLTDGRVTLVSFIYVLCGDSTNGCPVATSLLYEIHDASAASPLLAGHAQLVTLSFDPARDTPAAMAAYAAPMLHDKARASKMPWRMLTTADLDALKPLLDGFGQVVNRSGDGEVQAHLLRLFLLDAKGRIRNIYGLGQLDPRLLLADIETLLIEAGITSGD